MNPGWPENFPRIVADLRLDMPALIEASAGTGKTFAIEHLILRMCREKNWTPDKILVLSFTEKTTNELRDRVRECFRRESGKASRFLKENGEPFWTDTERTRFSEACLLCDEAAIHTLHGFCHSALRAHAIGNRSLFSSELAGNGELLEAALDGLLRGPWARDETRLRRFREALNIDPGGKWREALIKLALAYQPERGDSLEPQSDPEDLARRESQFRTFILDLENSLHALESAGFRKDVFARIRDVVRDAGSLPAAEKESRLSKFFRKGLRANNKAVKEGFSACLSKKNSTEGKWLGLAQACQNLRDAALQLEEEKSRQRFGVMAEAACELRKRLDWEKRRRGVLSYDDMVSRLVQALRTHPGLAEKLGSRFKACIVDEFQDTDPLQWELLQRLCLDGGRRIPLFLVGDPKQAIYSFRGGDLQTYLEARRLMWEKSRKDEAQGFGLRENHRSDPRLIAALNLVFSHPDWFALAKESPPDGQWRLPVNSESIAFTPAEAFNRREEKNHREFRSPIVLREFLDSKNKGDAQKSVQAWMAMRIRTLSQETNISFRDIAILTRSNFEAQSLEKYLRRKNIPCRVRQKGGVFHGPHADALKLLLDWLESSGDPKSQARLLLLPFLRGENRWPESLPEESPPLIQKWASQANAGRWQEFFHSLLFESGHLYRLIAETQNGSEVQALRALVRTLTEEGLRGGFSLRGLRERFDALRNGSEEESNPTLDGGGENRVTVMTLHMSKGLEFPVVFLAALSGGKSPSFYTLRKTGGGFRHVLDKNDSAARADHQKRAGEEDQRLFYVGMTRAKKLLFAPLPPTENTRANFGPLGDFAGRALRAAAENRPELFLYDRDPVVETWVPEPSASAPTIAGEWPERDPWEEAGAFFQHRRRSLSSYSRLLRRETTIALEEDGKRAQREEVDPEPTEALEATPSPPVDDLPRGIETGNALHALFENLDFANAAKADDPDAWLAQPAISQILTRTLRQHGLGEEHVPAAGRMAWNTLRMPLPDLAGGADFQLGQITHRVPEVEFLFPWNDLKSGPLPEGIHGRTGFLWGFMDLAFRHQGRYYLLDWKSNFLNRYDARSIAESMQQHRYDLQYQLYSVALDKWLKARLSGYDPEKHFGGLFYIYLRGASAGGPLSGFSHKPTLLELREIYPARLRQLLGLRPEPGDTKA